MPNTMLSLQYATPLAWVEAVLADFNRFLIDHAAAEKKASGMAISMLSHYPDRPNIVSAMVDLAIEEMTHFREVIKLLHARGLQLAADTRDPYVNALRALARRDSEDYLLDRLLIAGIIEKRGCERFSLVAEALPEGKLQQFYQSISRSEAKHGELFLRLAGPWFAPENIATRLAQLLSEEAKIVAALPITAALH